MTVSTLKKEFNFTLDEKVKTWFYLLINHRTKRFFFGQSKFSRKEERHKDDVYVKLFGDWKYDGYSTYWFGVEQSGIIDTKIHRKIKSLPDCLDVAGKGSDECFCLTGYSQNRILDVCKQFIKETFGETKIDQKEFLELRTYQKDFLEKINSKQNPWTDFLLFAKCRAGKTVMTYSYIVERKYKVTLGCSLRNSPKQSWFQDIEKYQNFQNIRIVDLSTKHWEKELQFYLNEPDIQIFIWTTVQGLNTVNNRLEKLKQITPVDFLVFDESHVGKYATKFKELRNKFSDIPCLSVSGTAYKQIWEYPENQRFVYSYYEEQLDNDRGVFHPLRPKMKLIVVKYESDEYRKIFGDQPDAIKNIFVLNDDKKKFLYPELVRHFIHMYFGPQRDIKDYKKRLLYGSQHLLICLPSIAACHLFAKMVENYYVPLVVTCDTRRQSGDIEDFLEKNKEGNTITITYEANVLGVTQERWDTIINCKEGNSREFWTQFSFRGGSGDYDWKVIDFCPQRALESLNEDYVTHSERNPEIRQRTVTGFIHTCEFVNGVEELSDEKICDILSADVTSAIRLLSGLVQKIDDDKLDDLDVDLDLTSSKNEQDKKVVNDNEANGESNEKFSSNKINQNSSLKEMEELLTKKKESLKAIMESIPLVIFWELKDGNKINSIESVLDSEFYVKITEDTMEYLSQVLDLGLLKSYDVLYRIMEVTAWISSNMSKDETMTLYELSITKNGNCNIPVEFLNEIFL